MNNIIIAPKAPVNMEQALIRQLRQKLERLLMLQRVKA